MDKEQIQILEKLSNFNFGILIDNAPDNIKEDVAETILNAMKLRKIKKEGAVFEYVISRIFGEGLLIQSQNNKRDIDQLKTIGYFKDKQ